MLEAVVGPSLSYNELENTATPEFVAGDSKCSINQDTTHSYDVEKVAGSGPKPGAIDNYRANDPLYLPTTYKAIPTSIDHKQHLHLPVRKRHLLASSTGSYNHENFIESTVTINTNIQDGENAEPQHLIEGNTRAGQLNSSEPLENSIEYKNYAVNRKVEVNDTQVHNAKPEYHPPSHIPNAHIIQHDVHTQPQQIKLQPIIHEPMQYAPKTNPQTKARSPPILTAQSARHSNSHGRTTERSRSTSKGGSTAHSIPEKELYCFCRRPYDPSVDVFMICCDSCDEWYHGSCVGVNQRDAKKISRYVCPQCKTSTSTPNITSEDSSEGEPSSPPSFKTKKRKNEIAVNNERKRQVLSPTLTDDISQVSERNCMNCLRLAQSNSKYCGHECGLEFARKQYLYIENSKKSSATEIADKETFDEIARKKTDIMEKLTKLAQEQCQLEKAIQFAKKMDKIHIPNSQHTASISGFDNDETSSMKNMLPCGSNSENTTIDCISCGHPIAVSKYTLHMERCYHKKESNVLMVGTTADGGAMYCNVYDGKTKTFCKKLKNVCVVHAAKRAANANDYTPSDGCSVNATNMDAGNVNHALRRVITQTCGCPTSDFQSGYCELTRKSCRKHHNWEELMRESISNQRTQHNKTLAGLGLEENAVRLRMSRRCLITANSHRTIEEA